MSSFKSSLFSVFALLAVFLCLLKPSQAVCLIDTSAQSGDLTNIYDTCSLSFPDCSNITVEALETKYGVSGFTITPVFPSRVTIMGGEVDLIKTALAQYLVACYNHKTETTTIYGK